jgi:serine/threonine protein kinase
MGVVYLARDTTLDRDVALKTLPDLRDGTVARLRDEARAMALLNHGSLATIYGLELWRRTPVIVVEYLAGGTLARRLERGPMSPAAVLAMGVQLAQALAYMHAGGVLHRDLKPSNIAFTAAGAAKLLDFGLATITEPSPVELPATPGIGDARPAGTRGYLPPESYRGAPPEPAVDLWALSVVLLEAMVGRNLLATAAGDRAIRHALQIDLVSACAYRPDRLALLTAFFERALAVRAEVRFHSSIEMLSALESLAGAFVDS